MTKREQKIVLALALREKQIRQARERLLAFTAATLPTFAPAPFHIRYYSKLTAFAIGEIKKLMVFMPPQHGKSEGSTRRLPAFLLGRNPEIRVAIVSYSAPKARKFNREIQRIIDTPEYADIFPGTRLNSSNVTTVSGSWLRNADECEIVGHRGGFKTVGVGGPLTGDPVDVLIMDDIYKDAAGAWSPTVRDGIADWYDTVAQTRLHNDSQQLIVFTRWHEDDLAGKLLREQGVYSEENPTGWVVVKFPALKVGHPTEDDPREEGVPLWPERHQKDRLDEIRKRNPVVFASLYQQDPKPAEGLMYDRPFGVYETIPASKTRIVKNYTDTADTGKDYLCSITYVETEDAIYVLDVIYTTKPMETTEPMVAEHLTKHGVDIANVESNNGGRGFARNVERQCRLMGNSRTRVSWFTQNQNKAVRIFTRSGEVLNLVRFPAGWEYRWPEFSTAVSGYLKAGSNPHDDAPDALTGIVEKRDQSGKIKYYLT